MQYVTCVKWTHVYCIIVKAKNHFDFDEIEEYLRIKRYHSTIPAQVDGSKSNFRRETKSYEVKDGHEEKIVYQKQRTQNGNYQIPAQRYWRFWTKGTINPRNNDDNWFQYPLSIALSILFVPYNTKEI